MGRVQGVGCRYSAAEVARRLGLRGWVRNTIEGDVESLCEGDPAALEQFVRWCERGPAGARVQSVERRPADAGDAPGDFRITR